METHTGPYGSPLVTQTDSGLGRLIALPIACYVQKTVETSKHQKRQSVKSSNIKTSNAFSKLIAQIVEESFYSVHLVVFIVPCLLVGDPDFAV